MKIRHQYFYVMQQRSEFPREWKEGSVDLQREYQTWKEISAGLLLARPWSEGNCEKEPSWKDKCWGENWFLDKGSWYEDKGLTPIYDLKLLNHKIAGSDKQVLDYNREGRFGGGGNWGEEHKIIAIYG